MSDMTDDEIRAMAGVVPGLDWPAARRSIDTAIERARREITTTVHDALDELGEVGRRKAEFILTQVADSLDDIDQTIPPEEDE